MLEAVVNLSSIYMVVLSVIFILFTVFIYEIKELNIVTGLSFLAIRVFVFFFFSKKYIQNTGTQSQNVLEPKTQ